MKCILCDSVDTIQIDFIPVRYLIKAYIKKFNTDISYLFSSKEINLFKCNKCDLQFYSPAYTGDNNYYNIIQKNDWYYRSEKEEYRYSSSFIKKADTVLDIGCGSGALSKYIPDAHFTGLEYSTEAIAAAKQKGITIINQSIEEHAIQNDAKYDVVTMFQVLEHVSNIKDFLGSALKCLKPGGKLIIAVPSEKSYIKFRSNAILNMPPHHISRWTDSALTNLTRVFGIDMIKIHHEKLDTVHYVEFLATFFERCFRLNLNSRSTLVNEGLLFAIRNSIAFRAARLFSKKLVDNCFLPIGQTVIAIYQKRTSAIEPN